MAAGTLARTNYANAILQNLPRSELALMARDLSEVELTKGARLFQADSAAANIYFPITSAISFIGDTGEGGTIEVWAVGNEGIAGVSALVERTKPFAGIVQLPGKAVAANANAMRRIFQKCTMFHDAVVTYYDDLLLQISYLGICNNVHPIEQRMCRWLLTMQDKAGTSELQFTQDAIAGILGTRRATISVAAAALQQAGLIRYTPGVIKIRSRKALEKAACRCYKAMNSRRGL